MNENELDHILKRAAIPGAMTGISLGSEVMARVRSRLPRQADDAGVVG